MGQFQSVGQFLGFSIVARIDARQRVGSARVYAQSGKHGGQTLFQFLSVAEKYLELGLPVRGDPVQQPPGIIHVIGGFRRILGPVVAVVDQQCVADHVLEREQVGQGTVGEGNVEGREEIGGHEPVQPVPDLVDDAQNLGGTDDVEIEHLGIHLSAERQIELGLVDGRGRCRSGIHIYQHAFHLAMYKGVQVNADSAFWFIENRRIGIGLFKTGVGLENQGDLETSIRIVINLEDLIVGSQFSQRDLFNRVQGDGVGDAQRRAGDGREQDFARAW